MELARAAASHDLAKDLLYRRWAALHGGVYVPITPETPPNPDLANLPERDLTTPSGRQLTVLSPDQMLQQIAEMATAQFGGHSHLTSLKPLRPRNAPDEWEAAALHAFAAGQKEVGSVGNIADRPYYRLMRPLVVEATCLQCHEGQGFRPGDTLGGLSTSVPLGPHRAVARAQFSSLAGGCAAFWVLGLVALTVGYRQACHRVAERQRAEAALRASEERYRAVANSANDAIITADQAGSIVGWNRGAEHIFGYTEAEVLGQPLTRLMPPRYHDSHAQALRRIAAGGAPHIGGKTVELEGLRKDGSVFPLELSLADWQTGAGHFHTGILRDITARKQIEAEREKLVVELKEALANVKSLSGLLPICAFCKKIRDDQGYWDQVDSYIAKHSAATFTHGYCPECIKKYYPGLEVGGEESR